MTLSHPDLLRATVVVWEGSGLMLVMITDPAAAGGVREVKLISGIDDHSRYCVIATVADHLDDELS